MPQISFFILGGSRRTPGGRWTGQFEPGECPALTASL
jgi:hypothetical protein